jgi:HPt (histidine-containing phosphotransfer) domain-containing protein
VHALKSTARMIGANVLADEAFEHENAAKDEKKDFIDDNCDKLLLHYKETVDTIQKALELLKN